MNNRKRYDPSSFGGAGSSKRVRSLSADSENGERDDLFHPVPPNEVMESTPVLEVIESSGERSEPPYEPMGEFQSNDPVAARLHQDIADQAETERQQCSDSGPADRNSSGGAGTSSTSIESRGASARRTDMQNEASTTGNAVSENRVIVPVTIQQEPGNIKMDRSNENVASTSRQSPRLQVSENRVIAPVAIKQEPEDIEMNRQHEDVASTSRRSPRRQVSQNRVIVPVAIKQEPEDIEMNRQHEDVAPTPRQSPGQQVEQRIERPVDIKPPIDLGLMDNQDPEAQEGMVRPPVPDAQEEDLWRHFSLLSEVRLLGWREREDLKKINLIMFSSFRSVSLFGKELSKAAYFIVAYTMNLKTILRDKDTPESEKMENEQILSILIIILAKIKYKTILRDDIKNAISLLRSVPQLLQGPDYWFPFSFEEILREEKFCKLFENPKITLNNLFEELFSAGKAARGKKVKGKEMREKEVTAKEVGEFLKSLTDRLDTGEFDQEVEREKTLGLDRADLFKLLDNSRPF